MTPTNDDTRPAEGSPGLGTSLRAGLEAGLLVGVLAGLTDALGVAAGLDSEFFVLQWQLEGLASGLPAPGEALEGVAGSLGSIGAAAAVYGLVCAGLGLVAGATLHPLLARRSGPTRRRRLFGAALGLWLALAVWWWTRPIVLPGYSSVHPLRLAALGAMILGGQVIGALLAEAAARLPRPARRAAPAAAAALVLAGGAFLLVDAPGRSGLGAPNPRTRDLPNVLLFVVDALRADPLERDDIHTPVLDDLARRGVMFENAMVQAPFTWSSFGSILTGKYPRRHGLLKMAPGVRMRPNVTIPYYLDGARRTDGVLLEEDDYAGAAFMTGTLSHGSGLLRGFDFYCEALVGHGLTDVHSDWSRFRSKLLPWLFLSKINQRVDREFVATTAVEWMRDDPDRRFVSLVHYYSTHTPYDPIEPHRSRYVDPAYDGPFALFDAVHRVAIEDGAYEPTPADVQQIKDLYHGGVTMADAMIGRVLDELQRQGRLDDTIVIVTSDHGEELGEHGLWEHNFMYQTNLRVPLLIAWPGGGVPEGVRVDALVETVDIFPTLCDLMRLELPAHHGEPREMIDGVSLVPLMRGATDRVKDWSFAENGRFVSIQDLERKLIVRRGLLEDEGAWEAMLADPGAERPRFYDLVLDPGEQQNVFAERTDEARRLFEVLRDWSASMPIAESDFVVSGRDRRNEQLLRGLGYGGGVGAGIDGDDERDGR